MGMIGIYDFDNEGTGKKFEISSPDIQINNLSDATMQNDFKDKLAAYLHVNVNKIELFLRHRTETYYTLGDDGYLPPKVRFDVVTYDTSLSVESSVIYLKIFCNEPYLFYDECDEMERVITVRPTSNDFIVNDLRDCAMETVQHKMYGDEFKDVIDLYSERKDVVQFAAVSMDRFKTKYKYVTNEEKVNMPDNIEEVKNLNFFMIEMPSNDNQSDVTIYFLRDRVNVKRYECWSAVRNEERLKRIAKNIQNDAAYKVGPNDEIIPLSMDYIANDKKTKKETIFNIFSRS